MECMFVCKDVFVCDAELTEETVVFSFDVGFVVLPAGTGDLAVGVRTVEAKEENGFLEGFFGFEADGKFFVGIRDGGGSEGGEGSGGGGGEDEMGYFGLAECTFVFFVEDEETESTDVTGAMIAGGDRVESDGVCADKACFAFGGDLVVVVVIILGAGLSGRLRG